MRLHSLNQTLSAIPNIKIETPKRLLFFILRIIRDFQLTLNSVLSGSLPESYEFQS